MSREYKTLYKLRTGETVSVDGSFYRMVKGDIAPGDIYVAERNTGPEVLTCEENIKQKAYIRPVEMAYSYDTWECVKVEEVRSVSFGRNYN